MTAKSKGVFSLRDAPCKCGSATYRWRKLNRRAQRNPRRCDGCDLTVAHCQCIVRLIVHQCPPEDSGIMPCCGRTPWEALQDRMTLDPRRVTCSVPA